MLVKFPNILVRLLFPARFAALVGNTFLTFGLDKTGMLFLDRSLKIRESRKFALSQILEIRTKNEEVSDIYKDFIGNKNVDKRSLDKAVDGWAFWNLNHKDFHAHLNSRILDKNKLAVPKNSERYLHDYPTNIGHIGALFLYINYFSKVSPNRKIRIPTGSVANKYYLDLIKRYSPLEIFEYEQSEIPEEILEDNMFYNYDEASNAFRIGADAAFYGPQDYSDWAVTDKFKLKINQKEFEIGHEIASSRLYDDRWLIALHVRQPKTGSIKSGQCRDADINTYKKLCEAVWDSGGMVVRMGDSRFPPFAHKGIVFDYANSDIRSEFMDCWFWDKIRFWVGNSHGGSIPPLSFGKPRFMTNMWYINMVGSKFDYFLPKNLVKNTKILEYTDSINSSVSRCMDWNKLENFGYKLVENEESLLAESIKEIIDINIKNKTINKLNSISKLELEIKNTLKLSKNTPTMNLPNAISLE